MQFWVEPAEWNSMGRAEQLRLLSTCSGIALFSEATGLGFEACVVLLVAWIWKRSKASAASSKIIYPS